METFLNKMISLIINKFCKLINTLIKRIFCIGLLNFHKISILGHAGEDDPLQIEYFKERSRLIDVNEIRFVTQQGKN